MKTLKSIESARIGLENWNERYDMMMSGIMHSFNFIVMLSIVYHSSKYLIQLALLEVLSHTKGSC